jgi:GNAT superfamily N-acetyltransferase
VKIFRRKAVHPEALIRRADRAELDDIVGLLAELVTAQVPRRKRARYLDAVRADQARRVGDPDTAWFVAERDSTLVGCARADLRHEHPLLAYLDDPGHGYLFGVFVHADERGHGTGARLLAACESWLKSRGARWAFLHSSTEALGFYRAEGYEPSFEFAKKL